MSSYLPILLQKDRTVDLLYTALTPLSLLSPPHLIYLPSLTPVIFNSPYTLRCRRISVHPTDVLLIMHDYIPHPFTSKFDETTLSISQRHLSLFFANKSTTVFLRLMIQSRLVYLLSFCITLCSFLFISFSFFLCLDSFSYLHAVICISIISPRIHTTNTNSFNTIQWETKKIGCFDCPNARACPMVGDCSFQSFQSNIHTHPRNWAHSTSNTYVRE